MAATYERRGGGRPPGAPALGARERVPVGPPHRAVRGQGRAPGGAAVGRRERVPLGRGGVLRGGAVRRGARVGGRARRAGVCGVALREIEMAMAQRVAVLGGRLRRAAWNREREREMALVQSTAAWSMRNVL
eukprot:TRINITY_DN10433_c0_g1_i1.p1 TRINITY_DN10433_c0_g1~~TRINITY_DN10433_c0_g1_i1.p1  ORF type:complete len:132 (+),score=15.71 TRINITY_DN10433_c0_g1_i1:104-499(+)